MDIFYCARIHDGLDFAPQAQVEYLKLEIASYTGVHMQLLQPLKVDTERMYFQCHLMTQYLAQTLGNQFAFSSAFLEPSPNSFANVPGPFSHLLIPGGYAHVYVPDAGTKIPPDPNMSRQNSNIDDNSLSLRPLRPWVSAPQNGGETSASARLIMVDETRSISEESHPQTRRRRISLGTWAWSSSDAGEDSSSEEKFAIGEEGWWSRQMLVDRSLRSMAALTTIFAIVMIALCCTYMSDFKKRRNRQSTSIVSKKPRSCRSTENINMVRCIFVMITCLVPNRLACLIQSKT